MHEISIKQHAAYLHVLLRSYGTVDLPLGSGFSFSLPQVFQPLRLRQSSLDEMPQDEHKDDDNFEEESEESDNAEEQKKILVTLAENGIEALEKSPRGRMVILGGPGSGKTTVLKHLLYHQAQHALEERAARLPIFLSLPNLARAGLDLDAYLVQVASDMGLEAGSEQLLAHAIRDGRAFVCLDGLDEVLPRLRAGIIRQINQLARRAGNIWIVGSRFTDYKGGQFQQGQFQEWELQPLDEERRLKLATQLLPELQRQLPQSVEHASPQGYVQALGGHRQAATWGANPLLFSLGAVVYLRRGNLSGSRAMLYREVIDALLETRHGDTQLRQILVHTALELYQIKGRTFTLNELQTILTNLNIWQQATWNVGEIRLRLLRSGVFDVIAHETYSFHHLMGDPNVSVRRDVMEVLRKSGDRVPLDVLIRATNDFPQVASIANRILAEFNQRIPPELFLELLRKESFLDFALDVLRTQGQLDRVPVQLLLDLYKQSWELRDEILDALNAIGHPRAKELLVDELVNKQGFGEEKERGSFIAEQREVLEARCVSPYRRAILILGYRRELAV
jgi:RecA/RadA recombinase